MDYELHLGDCREVLRHMQTSAADVVITDPPYNIKFKYLRWPDDLPEQTYINLIASVFPFSKIAISHYPEEMMKYVVPALGAPDHVGAWCYNSNIPRRFRLINYYGVVPDYSKIKVPYKNQGDKRIKERIENGSIGTDLYEWWDDIQMVKNVSLEKTTHPCPVPEKLQARIITLISNPGDTILDPFMGSGTTGVACAQLGRKFIGIELDPDYFAIAEKRIKTAYAQKVMF